MIDMAAAAKPPPQGPIPESELDARLKDLLSYWRGKCRDGRLPSRTDIDPLDLRGLLGNINLIDVVPQPDGKPRFRYRLFGTEFIFYHGGDLTGHWVDDIANTVYRDQLVSLYTHVIATAATPMLSYDYLLDSRRHRFQAVILPLASDGRHIDMILSSGLPVAIY
ncbi:PAS domain-containing protein [Ferrovibrio terrae]|uniref:PAS domain-containing protein n=1 Tax=Ferrovibrio terrae TaxID=2594003 RepID=UPI00313810DA